MTQPSQEPNGNQPALRRELNLLDAVLLLVGGVIGSGIFLTAGQVATELRRPELFLLVWLAGGIVSLLGCFAVAELAGMFPQAGGPYVFLRHAFGELPAFLYGWMIFAVVQTGTIAALAVGFALYLGAAFPALGSTEPWFVLSLPETSWRLAITTPKLVAVVAIALLTTVNVYGLRRGSNLVNAATWLKFAAMGALVIFGFAIGKGDWDHFSQPASGASSDPMVLFSGFGVALISVFFAYDGWVYITWVAGEMKDASRNLPRGLILGLSCVAVVYIAMNMVYLYALPLESIIASGAVVQASAAALFSGDLGFWLALMVAFSCFGAMCSAILCSARITYAMACDGLFFDRLKEVHPRYHTPSVSLVAVGAWSAVLALIGLYDQLLTYAVFMMILGYIAIVGALFVLRRKLPDHPRPYRCTGYPFVPILYVLITAAWTLNTIYSRPAQSLGGLGIVLLGIPGFMYWKRRRGHS